MPRIYLCFLWHMHQPFYKDLATGCYRLPWTRLHGLKDYYGMVKVLEDFPNVHQTFNLVPSMMVQLDEYAAGTAVDPFLDRALKPAEDLTFEDQSFILQYFFQANPARLIYRYPRYGELYDLWLASDRIPKRALRVFGTQAFRDLQVLSQLAWVDEEFQEHDPEIRALVQKGSQYSTADQRLLGLKQRKICGKVLPVYQEFAKRGQIEISTTPFYHPILPLLCDSNIADIAHPHVPLPSRFRYPEDARWHLERSMEYMRERFGIVPAGLWPSEGSVSDEAMSIAAEVGFKWFGTDNGVLARTLGRSAGSSETYRPYVWRRDGHEMRSIFRDHYLSDLVGFVYARMGAEEAASHFLDRILENCGPILASGRDALAPIILDGENAWEYYERNGRDFLRALYRRIGENPRIRAVTVSEALRLIEPEPLEHIFPGSWINANFDVWIGAEEDNKAWEYLLRAREAYTHAVESGTAAISEDRRKLAWEELMIAEGSDWCWWYGPEHESANRPEFDMLYREHLANVYRALDLLPPAELSRPILRTSFPEFHDLPSSPVKPTIDGEITSYFEWMGAGLYRMDARSGAMHGHRFVIRELHYGSDGKNLYLRLDLETSPDSPIAARLHIEPLHDGGRQNTISVTFHSGGIQASDLRLFAEPATHGASEFAFRKVFEGRLSLEAMGIPAGHTLRLQLSLWKEGLPIDSVPRQGWLEISTAEPSEWPV